MAELADDAVAQKVLRRAHVSKMTRALQNRLALANVKIQNGWQDLSIDSIGPCIDDRSLLMTRKRPSSSNDTISDTASTATTTTTSSSSYLPSLSASRHAISSPITAPGWSDDLPPASSKRIKAFEPQKMPPSATAHTRSRGRSARQSSRSWKQTHRLPESSPIKHARFASSSHMSFVSEVSTIPDDPPSPEFSEDDDADLPVHSFGINASSRITSSPPRTPSPVDKRLRENNVSWSRTPRRGEEGADLLMYLATSPSRPRSPGGARNIVQQPPPSTPPSKSTPLPSSHMTPGLGSGFLGLNPTTPGNTNFNFADFVNVTPSPAQVPWARTPKTTTSTAAAAARTPGARRKLNVDSLIPPSGSSPIPARKGSGLGMELGGELMS